MILIPLLKLRNICYEISGFAQFLKSLVCSCSNSAAFLRCTRQTPGSNFGPGAFRLFRKVFAYYLKLSYLEYIPDSLKLSNHLIIRQWTSLVIDSIVKWETKGHQLDYSGQQMFRDEARTVSLPVVTQWAPGFQNFKQETRNRNMQSIKTSEGQNFYRMNCFFIPLPVSFSFSLCLFTLNWSRIYCGVISAAYADTEEEGVGEKATREFEPARPTPRGPRSMPV